MSKIKVVGQSNAFSFDEIKDSVIFLGGKYYFKHDQENLVKINTPSGYRLYRKESALICKTVNGTYAKKSDCVKTPDGLYLDKNHSDTVKLDGGYTHKSWTTLIGGKFYLLSDENIVRLRNSREKVYALKKDCIKLCEEYYGKDSYDLYDPDIHITIDKEIWRLEDTKEVMTWNNSTQQKEIKIYTRTNAPKNLVSGVFKEFKDSTNPQIGRYNTAYALKEDIRQHDGLYILAGEYDTITRAFTDIIENEHVRITDQVKKKLNASFGDFDETENIAPKITKDYKTWPGKHRLYGDNSGEILSKSVKKTGGLGYSFGVEIETSAGLIPDINFHPTALPFIAVGDRSIGAAEYVTPILHGDNGINYLEKLCKLAAAHTLVDDKCSIHVHVGPSPGSGLNDWQLKFDKRFAIAAIKLGASIEEELYKMLPKARNPYNRHCHSIKRFEGINEDNWKEYLGTFVFGPQENWANTIDFRNYKYGEGAYSKTHSLSTWCGGRYKWLNLVRCYSSCNSPTIELRIWSPSTNFNKVYCYVLLSLAFVHAASSHYREVMKGNMTLDKMVRLAFPKNAKIYEMLYEFIEKRKASFDRRKVYDKISPEETIKSRTIVTKSLTSTKKVNTMATLPLSMFDDWD